MNNDIFLSIIIPVYNVENYLPACLDSILCQEQSDFEIILIDDGSTDGSLNICKDYAWKNPRIKVITQKNQGVSAARNTGIKAAKGEYITFIDSDDLITPTYLSSLRSCMNTSDDIVFFRGISIDENGSLLSLFGTDTTVYDMNASFGNTIINTLKGNVFGHVWLTWLRRTLLEDNQILFNEAISLHEDFLFTCNCVSKAKKVSEYPLYVYKYVQYNKTCRKNLSASIPQNYEYIAQSVIFAFDKMSDKIPLDREYFSNYASKLRCHFYTGCIDVICREDKRSWAKQAGQIKDVANRIGVVFPMPMRYFQGHRLAKLYAYMLNKKMFLACCITKHLVMIMKRIKNIVQ